MEPQVDLLAALGRIGEVFEVFGAEVVVSAVAENPGDPLLGGQRVEVVLGSDADQGGLSEAVDEPVHSGMRLRIVDAAEKPGRSDAERVVDLRLAPVLAVAQGVRDAGTEIAVVFEGLFCDPGSTPGWTFEMRTGSLARRR